MKRILLVICTFFMLGHVFGQVIYISTTNNRLYKLNIVTCNYVQLAQIDRPLTDISFHPDGTLYGVSAGGSLFVIDTLTGSTTTVYQFPGPQRFNSLTSSADGILYSTGEAGELWTYNKSNNQATDLGNFGYRAAGDLTFYKGKLYVAAENDRIILIDINNPSNSTIAINGNVQGEIFGIVSYASSCDSINCYAVSSGNSDIYEINFATKTLQLKCSLNIRVGGGASTYEFYGSAPIIFDTIVTVNPTCNHNDGSATINVTGGIAPLSYSLNGIDYQSSNVFANLHGGSYQFIVSDANGCNIIEEFTLANTDGPVIQNVTMLPTTCQSNNGEIDVAIIGGNGLVSYSIDGINFQSGSAFSNLGTGHYYVFVKDGAGCIAKDSILLSTILPDTIEKINVTHSNCNNPKGSLDVQVNNNNGVNYSIDGINFQNKNRFDLLNPGTYLITIRDKNGCLDTMSAILTPVVPVIIDQVVSTDPPCDNPDGSIMIISSGGTGQIQYSLDGVNFQNANLFDHLAPAGYTIIIRDINGCRDTSTTIIKPGVSFSIDQIQSTSPRCDRNDGTIIVTPKGGTGQIEFSIDGINFQNSNQFSNLGSGLYTIHVQDQSGCTATGTVMIGQPQPILVRSIDTKPTGCDEINGSVTIQISGGTGQIAYSLDGEAMQTSNSFQNLRSGDHDLTINDQNGCEIDTLFKIGQLRCKIFIPNTFSPNQDGTNDYFQLFSSTDDNVLVTKYMIFDRWGNLVYSASDFPLTSTEFWWDGSFKKMSMSPGVFAYYIEVTYDDGGKDIFKGDVTLVR